MNISQKPNIFGILSISCQQWDKGKMGITYPQSLKYYDLRQRYPRPNQGTRTTIEQAEHS